MAIHWQVKFKSLRAGTDYTVNIYDANYSGNPIPLKGGAEPFVTQEDDDEDMFLPVRTQSGYIRIVDDGKDANGNAFNWKDLLPSTDVDRPVTLTNGNGNTLWIGFMQAQNFGGTLYGNPQEREYPIQCPLSVISRMDVIVTNKDIQNFAYLLMECLAQIPVVCRPNMVVAQGGANAREWLKKKLDWTNLVEEGENNEPEGKYDYGTVLEDMCSYWGWCARIQGQTVYLTCADDSNETTALVLNHDSQNDELAELVSGIDAGTVETMFSSITIGDIFASTDNDDFQNRGPNTCVVKVDAGDDYSNVIQIFDSNLIKDMNRASWYEGYTVHGDNYVHYTKDILSCERYDLSVNCRENYASLNIEQKYNGEDSGYSDVGNVISIKKNYDGNAMVTIETKFEHCFSNGFFRFLGDTYRDGDRYESVSGSSFSGNPSMKVRFGIGRNRREAKWWDGRAWQNSDCIAKITIGNHINEFFTLYETSITNYEETNIIETGNLYGRIFLDLLGTDDQRVSDWAAQKRFDLHDFHIEFSKNDNVSKTQYPNSHWWDVSENLDIPDLVYKSKSNSMVKETDNVDTIYGSNDGIRPCYGLLINADGSYMSTCNFGSNLSERPEKHLCDRVVNYWETSKRKISCELLAHDGSVATVADTISPRVIATVNNTTTHPISISRNWRDDVVMLTFMEV